MKQHVRVIKAGFAAAALSIFLAGCATIGDAYQSTASTVSGWFKSGNKEEPKK